MTNNAPAIAQVLPLLLWCPECSARHIDVGEFATKPHHTHACQSCGHVWRPAIGHTVGVQFLPGFKNEAPEREAARQKPTGILCDDYPPFGYPAPETRCKLTPPTETEREAAREVCAVCQGKGRIEAPGVTADFCDTCHGTGKATPTETPPLSPEQREGLERQHFHLEQAYKEAAETPSPTLDDWATTWLAENIGWSSDGRYTARDILKAMKAAYIEGQRVASADEPPHSTGFAGGSQS